MEENVTVTKICLRSVTIRYVDSTTKDLALLSCAKYNASHGQSVLPNIISL